MVAPSFVTVISPSGEMRILSRPRGPNEVLTMFATVRAARIWDLTASLPYWRFFLPWLKRGKSGGVSGEGLVGCDDGNEDCGILTL